MSCFTVCCRQKISSPKKRTTDINEEIFSSVEDAKLYSYRELQIATQSFNESNKIGEGGFGLVYKGRLKDGSLVAIKVLSAQSEQGVKEFLNEIVSISGVEHENLVKLYGCCTEGGHRILVYGYLENNSLARTLLGGRASRVQFTWKIRSQICIGVAQGLAFLHEEVRPHIIHRDIKASNVLLDKDFKAKISDFGLAKLFPTNATHISTRVAGTHGYLAPEYAIRGKLTRKADVYSFGVLLMEIVSGRSHRDKRLPAGAQNLLEMAWTLYEKGLLSELVDSSVEGEANIDEACRYLKIGFLCTQVMPKTRPAMSEVAKMLKGEIDVDDENITKPALVTQLLGLTSSSYEPHGSSSGWGTPDGSSPLQVTNVSHGTMTFSSIYDRSN
ncbi:cold-responsive protein kinase 1-like [Salvia hispanica]|uniref:cold-responsive protein kinase 1-like n=1 Tax=Salvia hispanica TaxID=49212 RepID=UPI0020090816|nr:cold-responsive protein kinase 1-like [Salvia hispanica]